MDKSYFTRLAPPTSPSSDDLAGEITKLRTEVAGYAQAIEKRPAIAVVPNETALDVGRKIEDADRLTY